MASVQPRDFSLHLADLRNRPSELLENMFANADKFARDDLNCLLNKIPANYHQQMPQQVAGPTTMLNTQKWLAAQSACANDPVPKKKRKDSSKLQAEKRPRTQRVQLTTCAAFFNEAQSSSAHVGLSLGQTSACDLRPRVEDDASIVTSSKSNLVLPITLSDRLSAQITKQQNEIFNLLKIQMEQLRLIIDERTQQHSKTLLATVGEGLSRTLRARDVELEQMSQKNFELQQKVNHLSLETQAWQSKAWSYDAMVSALRANLQQVLMHQTKCQGKVEGFGDSDNDASSAYVDKAAQQTRETLTSKAALQRACKKCKAKEVSILLLPCLHLCLCKECRDDVERCPSCDVQIGDRVEVYLS